MKMKNGFACFTALVVQLAMCASVLAADLNLNSGESAVIQANVNTRVTCGGGSSGGSCQDVVRGFQQIMEACQRTYTGGYCAEKNWPAFKNANPSCAYAGVTICLEACQRTYTGGYCSEKCQ
jgi:hypothetical protein